MPSATINKDQGTYVIPAQHTDRLRSILAGTQPAPVPLERIVQQVFSSDYLELYNVPALLIKKLSSNEKATRLVLCADYDIADPEGSCKLGQRCKFVHADIRRTQSAAVHNNYAWRCLAAVEYERFPPGTKLRVAAPGTTTIVDHMDSSMVIKTDALDSGREPLSHCAHYYFNRTCNRGPRCQFIHAVFIDPKAKPHQRAPAPAQIGRPLRDPSMREASRRSQEMLPTPTTAPAVPHVKVGSVPSPPLTRAGSAANFGAYLGPKDTVVTVGSASASASPASTNSGTLTSGGSPYRGSPMASPTVKVGGVLVSPHFGDFRESPRPGMRGAGMPPPTAALAASAHHYPPQQAFGQQHPAQFYQVNPCMSSSAGDPTFAFTVQGSRSTSFAPSLMTQKPPTPHVQPHVQPRPPRSSVTTTPVRGVSPTVAQYQGGPQFFPAPVSPALEQFVAPMAMSRSMIMPCSTTPSPSHTYVLPGEHSFPASHKNSPDTASNTVPQGPARRRSSTQLAAMLSQQPLTGTESDATFTTGSMDSGSAPPPHGSGRGESLNRPGVGRLMIRTQPSPSNSGESVLSARSSARSSERSAEGTPQGLSSSGALIGAMTSTSVPIFDGPQDTQGTRQQQANGGRNSPGWNNQQNPRQVPQQLQQTAYRHNPYAFAASCAASTDGGFARSQPIIPMV